MKKYLLIITLFAMTNAAIATCPIEDASSCSIASFQRQAPMQRTYSQQSSIKEYSDTPETRLNPIQNDMPSRNLRDFGPLPGDYNYNTGCLFGVCNPSGTPQLFENRR